MKVKKYIAPTMPEAMKQIRAELGHDAVILNSKIVTKGGFLGLFKKQSIEVIAAVDQVSKPEAKAPAAPVIKEKPVQKPPVVVPPKPVQVELKSNREEVNSPATKPVMTPDVRVELEHLKKAIESVSSSDNQIPLPEPVRYWNQYLSSQEVDKHMRDRLIAHLLKKWFETGANASNETVKQWLRAELLEELATIEFGGIQFTKKYVNLVGPTGVGKTTTLAKIAADCSLKYKKKVALITTDTYRIAAIDQLKTYAKILHVPLEVCYNMEDYKQACETFKEYDIVLIDTAGRNFRNRQYVEDLKKVVDYKRDMETYLVLALTAKLVDMKDIYEQFSIIDVDRFIFTKADETSTYGSMLHMIKSNETGVAYITTGQNVPDDMVSANRETITNLILGVE